LSTNGLRVYVFMMDMLQTCLYWWIWRICRLYGMNSHDYHVFMQTLIPLAYQNLLPNEIYDALIKINQFFRDIYSNKLHTQHIERLEMNIVQTICKLEMIFLQSFFKSMEHLPIHLSFEWKVGDPVQYRWKSPFERLEITYTSKFLLSFFFNSKHSFNSIQIFV